MLYVLPERKFIGWFVWLPSFIRRLFLRAFFQNPRWLKEMNGTVSLSSVGMFGRGAGWAIPVSNRTLQVTLGGITEKPALIQGQLTNREYLCVTLTFDHDIVDGARAARFVQCLRELVECGFRLNEFIAQSSAQNPSQLTS